MGDYSPNFSHGELYEPDDIPDAKAQRNLRLLANGVLEPLRVRNKGRLAITKTQSGVNGYVGKARNIRRGGAKASEHCTGRGGDVYDVEARHSPEDLFFMAATLPPTKVTLPGGEVVTVQVGGLGLYVSQGCLHVDHRPRIDGAIVIWYKNAAGEYTDIPARIQHRLKQLGVKWVG